MRPKSPRLAARALLMDANRLLIVNAYPNGESDLMCAPGGGVEIGSSLPQNLIREVFEETGLRITVELPCLVNEFHDPKSDFHQVDIYFRCKVVGSPKFDPDWKDTDNIVNHRRWVSESELKKIRHKPDSLGPVAFGDQNEITYDPLEVIIR